MSGLALIREKIVGRKLEAVALSGDKMTVRFDFQEGPSVVLAVEADLFSEGWIESLEVPANIAGDVVVVAQEHIQDLGGEGTVYRMRFVTFSGAIVLKYCNSSSFRGSHLREAEPDGSVTP